MVDNSYWALFFNGTLTGAVPLFLKLEVTSELAREFPDEENHCLPYSTLWFQQSRVPTAFFPFKTGNRLQLNGKHCERLIYFFLSLILISFIVIFS